MFKVIFRRYKLIILIILLSVVASVSYKQKIIQSKTKKRESVKVKLGSLQQKMVISGSIDAREKVILRFQTSGKLAWVGIKEGDYVKKYQHIASLDQKELQKNLNKYLNSYLSERWDFDQVTKDDYKDKVITDSIKRIKEKAQFDLNSAIIDVEIKNLAVELSNLISPIEGIVTKVSIPFAGTNITPSQAEFEIVNPQTIYFEASADQTEVTDIKENLPGELTLDSYPDEVFGGFIKTISFTPKENETGTVYQVKFDFPVNNTDNKFRLGMVGDLNFITKSKDDILYIPLKFIKEEDVDDQPKKYVYIMKNDKFVKQYIETGLETDDDMEIVSGLTENEIVYNL